MLRLTEPPKTLPGGTVIFSDHQNPSVQYYLPPALALAVRPDGNPDFFLLRYHGDFSETAGGLLRFRLHLSSPSEVEFQAAEGAGLSLRAVPFDEARFRLHLRSWQAGQEDSTGEWHPAVFSGDELVAPVVSLDARETGFLKELLEGGESAVEVELKLGYQGLRPGLPWLVVGNTARLRGLLAASLPVKGAREDQVVAAFLSLSEGEGTPVSWRPLEPGAPEPARDQILAEVARRALDPHAPVPLFERQASEAELEPGMYRLLPASPGEPGEILWDLLPPRQEARTFSLAWSVNDELGERLKDPEKRQLLFPVASQVSPFALATVHVINRLPYDPSYLKRVVVDLRYHNDAGLLEFRSYEFNGQVDLERFSTFYQALSGGEPGDFPLEYRLTATLAPPGGKGWPVVRRSAWLPAEGTVVEVNRRATGMDFVRVEADPRVFEKASRIEVEILSSPTEAQTETTPPAPGLPLTQLILDASQPAHWVALPEMDPAGELRVRVLAHPPAGQNFPPILLREGPVQERRVSIAAYQLEVLDPDPITIRLDPEGSACCALVAICLAPLANDEGPSFTLELGQPVIWNFYRSSLFAPLRYRYRIEWIAIDPNGGTLPMQTTGWTTCDSAELWVRPPFDVPEVQA